MARTHGTCRVYLPSMRVLCNSEAVRIISIKSGTLVYKVPICQFHLSIHNDRAAHDRVSGK